MPEYPAVVAFRFPDLTAARHFYVDELGFTVTRESTEHEHISVAFGAGQMMLETDGGNFYGDSYNDAIITRRGLPGPNALYIESSDLDELYQRCHDRGIKVIDPIADRPWGQREFTIEDPAGNFLSFWGPSE